MEEGNEEKCIESGSRYHIVTGIFRYGQKFESHRKHRTRKQQFGSITGYQTIPLHPFCILPLLGWSQPFGRSSVILASARPAIFHSGGATPSNTHRAGQRSLAFLVRYWSRLFSSSLNQSRASRESSFTKGSYAKTLMRWSTLEVQKVDSLTAVRWRSSCHTRNKHCHWDLNSGVSTRLNVPLAPEQSRLIWTPPPHLKPWVQRKGLKFCPPWTKLVSVILQYWEILPYRQTQ